MAKVQLHPWSGYSFKETMVVDKLWGCFPFLALGALGVVNLVAAVGALRGARRTEELGEGRFELLRDQHDRGSSCCARSAGCC